MIRSGDPIGVRWRILLDGRIVRPIEEATVSAHLAALHRAIADWNAGDLDGYLSLYDGTIRLHGYGPEPMDKASVTGFYRGIFAALSEAGRPSPRLELHETVVDDGTIACRFTMSGHHQGEFMGVPATGLPYELPGITMIRFGADRTAVERWSTADFLSMLIQIGAVPAPV